MDLGTLDNSLQGALMHPRNSHLILGNCINSYWLVSKVFFSRKSPFLIFKLDLCKQPETVGEGQRWRRESDMLPPRQCVVYSEVGVLKIYSSIGENICYNMTIK